MCIHEESEILTQRQFANKVPVKESMIVCFLLSIGIGLVFAVVVIILENT
jgi:hypothetical protein